MSTVTAPPHSHPRPHARPSDAVPAESLKRKKDVGPTAEERRRRNNLSYWAIGWLALAHAVVLAAPFYFTWTALVVALVLHWFTGSLGICLGYHRLLTHTGMKTYGWVRYLFATIGMLAGEGTPLDWVADHRKHHACSDQEGDPHSPRDGGWWSHIFWLAYHTHNGDRTAYLKRWVPDLYKEAGMRRMDWMFLPAHILVGLTLFAIGYWTGGRRFRHLPGGLGDVCPPRHRSPCNLVGQQCLSHVGLQELRDDRRQPEQLAGCDRCLWRRLAQQSSRLSADGQARPQVVGV